MTEIAPRIVVDSAVRFGKPVIRGTRVPVAIVVAKLAGGMSIDELMHHYAAVLVAGEEILIAA